MPSAIVFGEDYAHEVVLRTLLERMAEENAIPLEIRVRSATGGDKRLHTELKEFVAELQRGQGSLPDLFVAARDANCLGYTERVRECMEACGNFKDFAVAAIPDPHIERWLLLDSKAFRNVLGTGCNAPDRKCDRDRYKQLLANEVRASGREPLLGGIEFAEDIVRLMNLRSASAADASFSHLIRDLNAAFRRWQ